MYAEDNAENTHILSEKFEDFSLEIGSRLHAVEFNLQRIVRHLGLETYQQMQEKKLLTSLIRHQLRSNPELECEEIINTFHEEDEIPEPEIIIELCKEIRAESR